MPQKNLRVFFVIVAANIILLFQPYLGPKPCVAAWRSQGAQEIGSPNLPWEIRASKLEYHDKEGVYVAEGDVVIKKGTQVLKANRAVYDRRSGIAKVWGDVHFESGGDIITGSRAVFDLNKQTGKIEQGHVFLRQNHVHISSRSLERLSEDTYLAKDCKITTCDGQRPAWSLTAAEVKVTVEGYGTAKHAAFRIKDVPVLYFPYFIFPAKTKRQSGLLPPRMGYSDRNGLDVELPFFWAISAQTDATFYERYMTKRGYMQGLEFRYITSDGSKGAFMFDILSDRKDKDLNDPDDAEISPLPRTNKGRYWFRGKADQNLPFEMEARLDVDYVSDQDYLKEFTGGLFGYEARPNIQRKFGRPLEERLSPLRSSNLLLSRLWEGMTLQADSHYYQRPDHPSVNDTPEPLLGLHMSRLISPIPRTPMLYSLGLNYQNIWSQDGDKGNEISLAPEVTMPLRLGRYVEIEPSLSFNYEGRWVDQSQDGTQYAWARDYEADLRVSSRMEKIFDVSIGRIERLRHTIRPSLIYTYHEARSDDNLSWFDPLTDKGKLNKLSFTLENFLDARSKDEEGKVSYRQWATFSLTQPYNLDELRRSLNAGEKRRPFDPLQISFTLKPLRLLDIYWSARWDHYDNEFKSNDLSVELSLERWKGRKDHYRAEYQSAKGEYRNLLLSADVGLWGGFSAGGSFSKDFYVDQEISSDIWLDYEAQCWGVKVVAHREDEETRFMVFFELKGLGQFRTW